jgi:hypothetical protein
MPTISLQSPSEAATHHPGDAVEVRWMSSGATLHDVELEIDDRVDTIVKGLAAGVRSHAWTIPAEILTQRVRAQVKLRVVARDDAGSAHASSAVLTIVPRRTPSIPPPPSRASQEPVAIESIDPKTGPVTGGTKLTLHGRGFQPFSIARIGGRDAATTFVSSKQLTVLAPAMPVASIVDVVVMNPGAMATVQKAFRYDAIPAPEIRTLEPKAGSTAGGTKVTIVGARFAPTTFVSVGGLKPLHTTFVDATTLEITTPSRAAPGMVDIGVVNIDGQQGIARNAFRYEAAAPPKIENVLPRRGRQTGGERVTLLGKNFAPGAAVQFGDAIAPSVRFVDETTIEIETPACAAGIVDVRVRNPDGQIASATRAFQFD